MYRASTPTFKIGLQYKRDNIEEIVITFKQMDEDVVILEKRLEDVEWITEQKFQFTLTQEETNMFDFGNARVQARVKTMNGKVIPSKMYYINVNDVLNDEVL